MRKTLIGLSMSAAVLVCINGAGAQERMGGDEPGGKKQMHQGEERRDAAPRQQRDEAGPGQNDNDRKAARKDAREDREKGPDARPRPRDAQADPDARRSPETKRAAQDNKEDRRDKRDMRDDRKEMKKDVVKEDQPRRDRDVVKDTERRDPDVRVNEKIVTKDRFAARPRLDVKQQGRLRETFRMGRVEKIHDVDFNVRVGRTVPARYHFNPVPAAIAEIVPQYRDYDYIDADNEIIITEPRTHRIVYTLPDEGDEGMNEPRCR